MAETNQKQLGKRYHRSDLPSQNGVVHFFLSHVVRKALFDNQWIRTAAGEWRELTTSIFSHDATGKQNRRDRFMGVENNQFFLSHGGFVEGFTESGKLFDRLTTGRNPGETKLPPMPEPQMPEPLVPKPLITK